MMELIAAALRVPVSVAIRTAIEHYIDDARRDPSIREAIEDEVNRVMAAARRLDDMHPFDRSRSNAHERPRRPLH